jgi:putative transposase
MPDTAITISTGEPDARKTGTSGSEGGRQKRTSTTGTSLAAYPTARRVRGRRAEETDQSKDRHRASARPHRQWCAKFGQTYANALRRRRARPGDKWHLDEVFIKIQGKTHYLWRAVDQGGTVLDILVTSRRDAKAAIRFFRKLLTGLEYVPRVLVTDKLASYGVAHRRLMRGVEYRRSKYLNNRAENSHQPTRQRERAMKRFTSAGHAQRFLSAFSGISPHFRTRRHLLHAQEYRREMTNRFSTWNDVTRLTTAA